MAPLEPLNLYFQNSKNFGYLQLIIFVYIFITFQPLWFTVQFLFLISEKSVEKVYGFLGFVGLRISQIVFCGFLVVYEILKACLVRWLVKLRFYHYYWPRNERGGNHTRWLMPISLHKSFPVLFSNHQRTDQSHLQNAL